MSRPESSAGLLPAVDPGVPFEDYVAERNLVGARLACILGAVLMPAGFMLDWFTHPEVFGQFLLLRLASAGLIGGLLILTYVPNARRWAYPLGLGPLFAAAGVIEVMVMKLEGYASPYYAGLSLVILSVGLLFTWRTIQSAIACTAVVTIWMVPAVIAAPEVEIGPFFNNLYFLSLTSIIATASNTQRYSLAKREYDARRSLARASAELEGAVSRLKEIDRLKSQFFANITHELRTPLTMILAPLESMLAGDLGPLQPAQRAYLEANWRNGIRLLKLINDLLDLAKLDEGFLRLRPEQADLAAQLEEIIEHARPLAARKNLELALTVDRAPENLFVDSEKMERVITNLLANALKFTESGSVQIRLDSDEREARVVVEDTGVGIPFDQLEAVFERFSQADASVARRYGGTGLGLAYAREIAELHGGRIRVTSEVGHGSRFVVHLPLGDQHFDHRVLDRRQTGGQNVSLKRKDDIEPREWAIRLQRQKEYRFAEIGDVTERRIVPGAVRGIQATRVLVVEDHPEILELVHLLLQQEHSVYVAQNGRQGLDLATRERPDVIVTDFMMPELDGLSMLRALRADPATADIPVVMLTAKNQLQDRLDVREAGADVYLAKPFSPRELATAVRQLLASRGRQVGRIIQAQAAGLDMLAAGLAHEINNPLGYIKNAQGMIAESLLRVTEALAQAPGLDPEALNVVRRSQEKMARLVDSANSGIARIEQIVSLVRRYAREGYPNEPESVHLDKAIRDVAALVGPKDGSECAVNLDLNGEDALVRCIPEEINQVIGNLIQNAIDSAGAGGRVAVRTRRDKGALVLEVLDNGPGIAPENLQKIFTPFFSTKAGGGMGLGLSIVQDVVTRAGGSIEVSSIPNRETTMHVRLPVFLAAEKPAGTPSGSTVPN